MRSNIHIRLFEPRDAEAVAALFAAYMDELFGEPNRLTPEILLRDGQGHRFRLMLAVNSDAVAIGFAAWRPAYDLHHAVAGADIPDLFVARKNRGHAVAVRLVATIARVVRDEGGTFVRGEVLTDDPKRMRLVHRLGVGFPHEAVYVSGRGFRELADLADTDTRTLVQNLPSASASKDA